MKRGVGSLSGHSAALAVSESLGPPGPGGSRRLVQHCTSGKGVADLHMRVAGRPKYYTFPEYKFFQMSDLVYYMFV